MKLVSLSLLNSIICHVGFYKNRKYKNNHSSIWFLLPSPHLYPLSAFLLSLTNSISNLPPATGILNTWRLLRRKGFQQGGCSKQQAPAWARGHSSLMLEKNLPPKSIAQFYPTKPSQLSLTQLRQTQRRLLFYPHFRRFRAGEEYAHGQLLGGWDTAWDPWFTSKYCTK